MHTDLVEVCSDSTNQYKGIYDDQKFKKVIMVTYSCSRIKKISDDDV